MANLSIIVSDFVITPIDADRYNLNTMLDVYQRVMALNKQFGLNVEYLGFFLNKCVLSGDIDKQLMDYYKQNFPELYIDHPIRLSRDVSQKSGYSRSMFLEYSKRAGAGLDLLALVVNDLGMIDKTHQKKLVENGISKKMMKPKNKLGDNKF
jgi:cellulose biosynthesis protein BcsQ